MKKLAFGLLFGFILLTSCQLQKVTVNVYTPPKLVFPPEMRSVLVTSRFVPATGPYDDVQWGAYESVDSLKWSLSESIVDTLARRMAEHNTYLVKIRHLPRMLRHNEATLPNPLPWEGLLSLVKKEYVQSLLIIEGFGISKTPVTFEENNGKVLAGFSVDVTLALRVYEPEKMRLVDDSVYTFTSVFKGSGNTQAEAAARLPEERKAMFAACSKAAEDYFALIKPGEEEVKRYYYSRGDTTLVKADSAIRLGKWGRAESKWKWLAYNSPDTLIQAKASFNMALACETDGRLNQAIGFARRSERLKHDKRTTNYINLLDKKYSEIEEQVKQNILIKRW